MSSKRAVFFYNNFYPAWKAGGPVQSLNNLVNALSDKMDISVVCSAYDLNEKETLSGISLNEWNNVLGVKAYYVHDSETKYRAIKKLIWNANPEVIYLNGLYSIPFVIYPLLFWQYNLKRRSKLFLAPRGMLQQGALNVKPFKKKVFLLLFKVLRLYKDIQWHATDEQEEKDIKRVFGESAKVHIAPNIPKKPVDTLQMIGKAQGELRLVYLSLITEKKNLHLALKWIVELNLPVVFDIYGPVKDQLYWEKCVELIENVPQHINIRYMGEVLPDKVLDTFSQYHALFLPTKGENFGHAIYECLSIGRPVLISNETPWKNLEKENCGFDIPIEQPELFKIAIEKMFKTEQKSYDVICKNAQNLAMKYWAGHDFESIYMKMFN